ncbi:von Willebrand factor A domain-containing protein 5A-like isoform X3 [Channa argus]
MMDGCGLLTSEKKPVPLKTIDVELEVRDHVATVVSNLNYENKEDKPLEAVFVFPLPGDAAVCHFSAKIGQTEIVAEVKEKQQAREEYDDALSSGQQAFLLEESDQSPDIFSLSVGSLPPGESSSIRLEYVTELAVQGDDGLRFCLPAVLNPRYQPQGSEAASVQVTSVPASLVPYSLSFSARVSSSHPVTKVESSCSLGPLQYLNTEQTQAMVRLAAGHKFDRDVELLIYYKDAHQPTAVVEAGQASVKPGTLMGDPVVMVSLYPEFPKAVMSTVASCGEFVFLLDRSGSMDCSSNNSKQQETRIGNARDTLLLLLKSLPMGCYFNIYSFGSTYESIFPKSVEYSETTMEEALKKVEKMDADLGGTEILEPLKHIYSQSCIPNQPRQLFVFTDGEVGNTKEVLNLVTKNSGSHRCFSFGIGEGASSALINGLAKEGRGHAQFITGTDRMQTKVMQSMRFALQPAVENISVTWDLPKGVSVTVLSPPITTIFQGQRSLVYAQLTGQSSEAAEGSVRVKYSLAGYLTQNQLRFSLKPAEDTGLTIHRLGAQTLIRSLEMEEREHQDGGVKEKVVELSVQSGVSSSFTAFIAVMKSDGKVIQGPLLHRAIPVATGSPLMHTVDSIREGVAILEANRSLVHEKSNHLCILESDISFFSRIKKKLRAVLWKPSDRSLQTDGADYSQTSKLHDTQLHKQPPRDNLLKLVGLQKASGCWLLDPALAAALGRTSEEVEKTKPASLIHKLVRLGLNTSLCNRLLDFLTGRPQAVRVGSNTSSTITLNTGAPQGCVLSPLLFTLLTHDCTPSNNSNLFIKFADDMSVVGLISNNDETNYRSEVRCLAGWCSDNNLSLNVEKMKEMVVDFRRALIQHIPLTINGANVERVSSTKFLGVHITEDLSWTDNTAALAKKSQQRLYFLRKLRRARAPSPIMYTFYRGTIESILTSCITVWYGACNASCRKTLQRIVRAAEKMIGVSLPSLQDIYGTRLTRNAEGFAGHPSHSFFSLLPSGRRMRSLQARTSRLKDSFIHQAVRKLNSLPNLPPLPSSALVLYCTGTEL